MNIVEIIEKKRDNQNLSSDEIQFWIEGVTDSSIPDYQTSALLMAIVLNGMTQDETNALTKSMLHSGDIINLDDIVGKKVDKHSTGGVGDKTTMILSPLVAACGAKVAKMSGRGLGHTGGTLDKLESIPNFNINLESQAFIDQVNDINVAVVGQTGNLVYADKVLYSLRDVTGTVNAIPLIASSIMSKKLAGGANCILLDVKYGEGAFMKTVDEAKELAQSMILIGESMDLEMNAMISNMNQPLGKTIGNALEVYEAVLTLKNQGPKELEELCLIASGIMLRQAGLATSDEQGYEIALENLRNGNAYRTFLEWIAAQGGDVTMFDDLDQFIESNHAKQVIAKQDGFIHDIHALELGMVSMHLGAGRQKVEDTIDYKAGIIIQKEIGDSVKKGDVLCELLSSNPIKIKEVDDAEACFIITSDEREKPQLIADVL
ncbi:thymidine phosphorylase [Erysipelothrix urinaevulpis]|uniref:thymidine phosphorylase n=1 Tax=Erysipelothrix urinaevulpis TaxID=2683717 RepID=UPI0013597E7C|nr:thymidine phosphorylase [Erysipelothrix urinaevulpis]